jgi:hypothetical protein
LIETAATMPDAPPHSSHFSVNMTVNLFALLVFYVLQTMFWWFIASQEVKENVRRKARALYSARTILRRHGMVDEAVLLDAQIQQTLAAARPRADDADREAHTQNVERTKQWIGPPVMTVAVLFLATYAYNRARKRRLTIGHRIGMGLVLLSYIPEILFFLFVIERYNAMGVHQVARRALGFLQPEEPFEEEDA